ncbi:MAG TPA: DUF962 domain-containing protein [Gemmatimonadales bacterium]|jgi:Predicted membrane protein
MDAEYRSFREFYPAYLAEHKEHSTRRLHFVGTLIVIVALAVALLKRDARWLLLAPLFGYGLAWIGHFVFERNRPATFRHPLYSLAGDFVMFKDILLGRLPW